MTLDYSSITDESLAELSKCDLSLLNEIYSRCSSNKLNSSHATLKESLDLSLTFERVLIFKKIIKDFEPLSIATREYAQLIDSLSTHLIECKEILDTSLNKYNSATLTISKTLESAEREVLTHLINTEIIDKFNILESNDFQLSDSHEDNIQVLTEKGLKYIDTIRLAREIISEKREYRALTELIELKNFELDSICEQLYNQLLSLIKDYSTGSQPAESFLETLYLKDEKTPFNKSLAVLSHREIYFNYFIDNLIRAKIKRATEVLLQTRFDSISDLLAFAHEIREDAKGFINTLIQAQQLHLRSEGLSESSNIALTSTQLADVLYNKLSDLSTSKYLKTSRLLTFYIDKYEKDADTLFSFLETLRRYRDKVLEDFSINIEVMEPEFVQETNKELESGDSLITCDEIEELVTKFIESTHQAQ